MSQDSNQFDSLPVRTQDCGIATQLGLGEYDSNTHSMYNGPAPQILTRRITQYFHVVMAQLH